MFPGPRTSVTARIRCRLTLANVGGDSATSRVSDSGGIQEEVPHLGVPLLVPRSCTERPEGVATGFVRIVAVERDTIVREALALLDAPRRKPLPFDRAAPFGDGAAAARIVDVLETALADAVAA